MAMALFAHLPTPIVPRLNSPRIKRSAPTSCLNTQSNPVKTVGMKSLRKEYAPGILDNVFLNIFRSKLAQEGGWDSERPGYDGLIDCARRLIIGRSKSEASEIAVRILVSLFPPLLLELYKKLISHLAGGKVAAEMVDSVERVDAYFTNSSNFWLKARVTAISCQWLMGTCTVNSVDIANGTSWASGVFVERCKYLEESKCVGVCINTCKLPTQTFIKEHMGVPLLMEPNFNDYSCQFKFGVHPPPPEDDSAVKEPCLQICPTYNRRKELSTSKDVALKCPNA